MAGGGCAMVGVKIAWRGCTRNKTVGGNSRLLAALGAEGRGAVRQGGRGGGPMLRGREAGPFALLRMTK